MQTSFELGQNNLDAGPPITGEIISPNLSVPEADPMVGKVLNGRFTVLELIGSGGMGRVYKALQAPLERIVAIKILNPQYAGGRDPGFQKRFFLEASLTSKLHHSNTITIIDYGRTNEGIFFIAMEYLHGATLAEMLASKGPLPWTRVLSITQQVCRSLREAHKQGIVHRDLKPANIMLLHEDSEQDMVKVLDFGLVKSFAPDSRTAEERELTQAGVLLGSPMYMAPEQAKNQVDPRSDVYSLGLVVYQMLTGKPPFRSKEPIDLILKHVKEAPPPMRTVKQDLQVPRELEAVVMRCLEKDPAKRFQSMEEMLEGLRRAGAAGGLTGTLSRPSVLSSGSRDAKTYRALATAEGNGEPTLAVHTRPAPRTAPAAPFKKAGRPFKISLVAALVLLPIVAATLWTVGETPVPEVGVARDIPTPTKAIPPPLPVEAKTTETVAAMTVPAAPVKVEGSPKMVHFVVSSAPSGATVTIDGRNLGKTPLQFDLEPNPEGIATAQLVLSLDGFERTTVMASGSGPEVVLNQQLLKKSRVRKISSTATGYKDDPYQ